MTVYMYYHLLIGVEIENQLWYKLFRINVSLCSAATEIYHNVDHKKSTDKMEIKNIIYCVGHFNGLQLTYALYRNIIIQQGVLTCLGTRSIDVSRYTEIL